MLVEKVKLGILEACICKKYIKEKSGEKFNNFYWRLVVVNQVFVITLASFGFKMQNNQC